MNDEASLPQKKLRLLGNILLFLACLGVILGLILIPFTFLASSSAESDPDPEIQYAVDEAGLPEGISMETTVQELLEYDRNFFEENKGRYWAFSSLTAFYVLAFAILCIRLALSWRKSEVFGRPSIIGLRLLGFLLVFESCVGWFIIFFPESWHVDTFFWSDLYQSSIDFVLAGTPTLATGIMFLILSWVLDYGRMIKQDQALTI